MNTMNKDCKRILLVEDEQVVSTVVKKILVKHGYEIIGVLSRGEEVLPLLATRLADLIIMDVFLKGELDGIKTAELVKNTYDIPIIFLTSFEDNDIGSLNEKANTYGYLIKPFHQRELISNVEIALYKHNVELELKKGQKRQDLFVQVLKSLNQNDNTGEVIRNILMHIYNYTGYDVIGLRIKDGMDYPFFQSGMDDAMSLLEENYICLMTGSMMKNNNKSLCSHCICNAVMKGMYANIDDYFTGGGSFWTGNISRTILETGDLPELQAVITNIRNNEYNSIAIIPLRFGQENIGLLQLIDKRTGMFSQEQIEFFEGIGASIAIALERRRAKAELRRSLTVKEHLLKREKRLNAKERQLQKEVFDAIQNERKRIGQDLHDGLGQNLTAIGFLVEALHKKLGDVGISNIEEIDDIHTLIGKSIVHTKVLSKLLCPVEIGDTDLASAVEGMAANISRLFNIECTVKQHGDFIIANNDTAQNIFYIITEAVNNSLRHGKPDMIEIALGSEGSGFAVTIQDNGRGMDNAGIVESGLGLKNMRNRAHLINADLVTKNNALGFMVGISFRHDFQNRV